MKPVIILLIFTLLGSCSKKVYPESQPDAPGQETQKQYTSFVFDIDSFGFLDEFPRSIAGIKAMYPDEGFEETTFVNTGKGPLGKYAYTLRTSNIYFIFWGDTAEEAGLNVVEIFDSKYQCKTMQIIGMPVSELESLSGQKINRDKRIIIYTDLYGLSISTDGNIVQSYVIIKQL